MRYNARRAGLSFKLREMEQGRGSTNQYILRTIAHVHNILTVFGWKFSAALIERQKLPPVELKCQKSLHDAW